MRVNKYLNLNQINLQNRTIKLKLIVQVTKKAKLNFIQTIYKAKLKEVPQNKEKIYRNQINYIFFFNPKVGFAVSQKLYYKSLINNKNINDNGCLP